MEPESAAVVLSVLPLSAAVVEAVLLEEPPLEVLSPPQAVIVAAITKAKTDTAKVFIKFFFMFPFSQFFADADTVESSGRLVLLIYTYKFHMYIETILIDDLVAGRFSVIPETTSNIHFITGKKEVKQKGKVFAQLF